MPGLHDKMTVLRGSSSTADRVDAFGAQVVTAGGFGDFGEGALNGSVFHGSSVGLTLLTNAGNIVGATQAQSVTATNTALFNPSTSTSTMILLRVSLTVDSGTFAAGGVYHGVSTGNTVLAGISGAAAGTNGLLGAPASQGRVFTKTTASTYTGAGVAATSLLPFAGTTATAAANGYVLPLTEYVGGLIVLPPGTEYRPLFAAVGTTVVFNVGYSWLEIPAIAA